MACHSRGSPSWLSAIDQRVSPGRTVYRTVAVSSVELVGGVLEGGDRGISSAVSTAAAVTASTGWADCGDEVASTCGCPTLKKATKTAATMGEVSGWKAPTIRRCRGVAPARRPTGLGGSTARCCPRQPGDTSHDVDQRLVGDPEGRPCGAESGQGR